jgi:hypothetical protein
MFIAALSCTASHTLQRVEHRILKKVALNELHPGQRFDRQQIEREDTGTRTGPPK